MLKAYEIIYYISILIWLLPPVRQYKGKFFFFFLALAIVDPFSLLLFLFHQELPVFVYLYFNLIRLLSLIPWEYITRYKYYILVPFLFLTIPEIVGVNIEFFLILESFVSFLIFLFLLTDFVFEYVNYRTINMGLFILMLFELTTILKIMNIIFGFTNATLYYITTTLFQNSIGIIFILYKVESPKFKISLRRSTS